MNAINYIKRNVQLVAHAVGWAAKKTAEEITPHIKETFNTLSSHSQLIRAGAALHRDLVKTIHGPLFPSAMINSTITLLLTLANNGENPLIPPSLSLSLLGEYFHGAPYNHMLFLDDREIKTTIVAGILGLLSLQRLDNRNFARDSLIDCGVVATGFAIGEEVASKAYTVGLMLGCVLATASLFSYNLHRKLSGN